MKMSKFAALSFAVLLYATAAVAQHGHAGGGAGGMGLGADHRMGISTHGNSTAEASGSSHQSKISEILDKNPAIGDKIATLTGDKRGAADACTGFKNLGQCVAAAHVAKNLSKGNFYCLRQAMTGVSAGANAPSGGCSVTGNMSLGKAIQTLYPRADSKTESKKGTAEAQQDLKSAGVQS